MTYDLAYSLVAPVAVFLAVMFGVNFLGHRLAFMVPALRQTRDSNHEVDRTKGVQPKYVKAVKASKLTGFATSLFFLVAIAPFILTLEPLPWWRYPLDIFIILMAYDALYYLTHRFLFHGQGQLRRVHALHHQARRPTLIDGHYVHPVETFIGLALIQLTMVGYALATPEHSLHAVSAGLTAVIYLSINVINHAHIQLPYSPFKTLNWIAAKHSVHHENMHKGNYASITLLYDKLFGTLD